MTDVQNTETTSEERRDQGRRSRRRAGIYLRLIVLAVLVVVLVALVAANTPRTVEVDWVFGTGDVSLVWIIVGSVLLGCVAGMVMGALIRRRMRRSA